MKINKAVIAAAGWSTRFLPTVKAYAKHLVPVLNKPQIQLVVEELVGAGITEIAIIHRADEKTIRQHFAHDQKLNDYLVKSNKKNLIASLENIRDKANLTFIPQNLDLPYGNGTPIIVAKDFIGSDPFFYCWGDDLTIEDEPGKFLRHMMDLYQKYNPDLVLATQEVPWEEVHKYGTLKYQPDSDIPNRVIDVPEKLPREQAPSNMINGARFIVTPKIIDILKQQGLDRGELWFTQAASYFAQNGLVISANYHDTGATWVTTGDPFNFLKANILYGLQDKDTKEKLTHFIQELKL